MHVYNYMYQNSLSLNLGLVLQTLFALVIFVALILII